MAKANRHDGSPSFIENWHCILSQFAIFTSLLVSCKPCCKGGFACKWIRRWSHEVLEERFKMSMQNRFDTYPTFYLTPVLFAQVPKVPVKIGSSWFLPFPFYFWYIWSIHPCSTQFMGFHKSRNTYSDITTASSIFLLLLYETSVGYINHQQPRQEKEVNLWPSLSFIRV